MANSVADTIRVAAQQKWADIDDIVNVFHFVILATPTPNTDVALMEDVAEKLSIAWSNIQSAILNALTPDLVVGFNLDTDAPLGITSWPGPYTGGTATGESMPTDDAALVLWSTNVKRKQGRTYLGPFTEAQHANSLWLAGLQTAIGTWSADMLDTAALSNGTELQLVIHSRSGGTNSIPTAVRIQPIVAQQQRRKLGRGS